MRRRTTMLAVLALLTIVVGAAFVGRRQAARSPAQGDEPSMRGATVLITGSTDGLGREVARRVAARGAHVIVHGRNQERGNALVKEIAATGTGSARFYAADFASLAAVRTFAEA